MHVDRTLSFLNPQSQLIIYILKSQTRRFESSIANLYWRKVHINAYFEHFWRMKISNWGWRSSHLAINNVNNVRRFKEQSDYDVFYVFHTSDWWLHLSPLNATIFNFQSSKSRALELKNGSSWLLNATISHKTKSSHLKSQNR